VRTATDATTVTPFTITVSDSVLADLYERLDRTRLPDQIPDTGWELGTDRDELAELCRYWRHDYQWRAEEAELNRLHQFTTVIDGQQIHFAHLRSSQTTAIPLVLLHGWPGSIVEFTKVVGPLTSPDDPSVPAFELVIPSLPGFAWSGPTHERGWDVRRMARAIDELMVRLGFDQYAVQGGDAGAIVATQLGMAVPGRLLGIHLNLVVVGPPDPTNPMAGLSPDDVALVRAAQTWAATESGYSWIQGTRPQTLAYGLTDSPAGLAAWILEKFRRWSDCDGDVWSRFTREELLTNTMLYWVTATIGSSTRLYFETRQSGAVTGFRGPVNVPTAVAVFPKEHNRYPRRWVEPCYDLRRWTEMPRGGHFAALEEPDLLVDDIRAFVADVVG
jgi:microsomal epoxide hydrolase